MNKQVPENAPDVTIGTTTQGDDHNRLELEVLTLEARNRVLENREINQRQVIRWIAVGTGLFVIIIMLTILWHALHQLVWWGPILRGSAMFTVAVIVTPTVAVTTITVTLFIGAFKKFEDKDAEHAANGISTGLNLFRGG